MHLSRTSIAVVVCVSAACARGPKPATPAQPALRFDPAIPRVVPAPASLTVHGGEPFALAATTRIIVDAIPSSMQTADLFAALLRPATGFDVPVLARDTGAAPFIALRLDSTNTSYGADGYALFVTRDSVRVVARNPAGLYYGTQTLRQLLPPAIESHMKLSRRWTIPAITVRDESRFSWRGAMLDVSRHFFSVREVKQYIDILAMYKMNVLHLHLADDQGWRIEIKSRPKLTAMGSVTQVGGGPGGFYTQAEYAELVSYAAARFITIVPEIDMPGHTNAALVAYPELSCSRRAPALYTGTDVGFSAFCPEKEETYALIDDVIRELAGMTPGSFIHIGGDEVEVLTHEQYNRFVERVQNIVAKYGKSMIGWEEIAKARLRTSTRVQLWRTDSAEAAIQQGAGVILSHGKKLYFDMKYTPETELGLAWAGHIEVRDVYDWDPGLYLRGVSQDLHELVGLEAPIWSETVRNITAVEFLAMPRIPALAEVTWSPQGVRRWEDFRERLASHAARWNFLGINYYRSPQIPW